MAKWRTGEFKGMLRVGDVRDIEVARFELEREDVMKFKPLYEALHDYLFENGFVHPLTEDDKYEDLYWERWTPSGAKEQHIWWRFIKKTNSPYVRYFIELNFQSLNVTKAEVAYKGRKVGAEKNDLIFRGRAFLQWDIDNKLQNSIFEAIKKVFFNRLYVEEIDQHKVELSLIAGRLQTMIKGYFEQTHDVAPAPNFQPVMGYKEPIGTREPKA